MDLQHKWGHEFATSTIQWIAYHIRHWKQAWHETGNPTFSQSQSVKQVHNKYLKETHFPCKWWLVVNMASPRVTTYWPRGHPRVTIVGHGNFPLKISIWKWDIIEVFGFSCSSPITNKKIQKKLRIQHHNNKLPWWLDHVLTFYKIKVH